MRRENLFCNVALLITLLVVYTTAGFSKPDFESLEDRFLEAVEKHNKRSTDLNETVRMLITDIENRLSETTQLESIEQFTLPYYLGYLHYIDGLHNRDPKSFEDARKQFQASVQAYNGQVQPEKKAFATYMQAWCDIRTFLISSETTEIQKLKQAYATLQGLLSQRNRKIFFKDDIHFLKGLAYYLFAKAKFRSLQPAMGELNQAIADFVVLADSTTDLSQLSQLYLPAAYFMRSQYFALGRILPGLNLDIAKDTTLADLREARVRFDNLRQLGGRARSVAKEGTHLTVLQEVSRNLKVNSTPNLFSVGQTDFSDLNGESKSLLEDYANFLSYLSNPQSGVPSQVDNPERKFWRDWQTYQNYLSDFQADRPYEGLFSNDSTKDWRSNYVKALAGLYRKQFKILGNQFSGAPVDEAYLLPDHKEQNDHLDKFLQLRNRLAANYDITQLSNVRNLIGHGSLMTTSIDTVFPSATDENKSGMLDFSRYFMALATKNHKLYPVAYLIYQYLDQLDYNREKMTLLKAYSEFKYEKSRRERRESAADYTNVLTSIREQNIANFSNDNKYEARYYRVMVYREIDADLYSDRVVSLLDSIKWNHPIAGYELGYQRYGYLSENENLLNHVFTQACNSSTLTDLCESCKATSQESQRTQSPWHPRQVEVAPVYIGDQDVRFQILEGLSLDFAFQEKKFAAIYWQIFSLPPSNPVLTWPTGEPCQYGAPSGPLEFYIGSEITVKLRLGRPGIEKYVVVTSSADTCKEFMTVAEVCSLKVLALRPYTIKVAIAGNQVGAYPSYPTVIDTSFRFYGETIPIPHYDDALMFEGATGSNEAGLLRVDHENDYYIAAKKDEAALNIYKGSGKLISNATYSAISSVGDRYFVLDRLLGQVRALSSKGQLSRLRNFDEADLNKPSDLTGFGRYLVIANSGDNSVVFYPLEGSKTDTLVNVTIPGAEQIESIIALNGKLFITDWKKNTIWFGDQSGFEELPAAQMARDREMLVPGKISIVRQRYFVVADLVSNKLFLFDKSREFLDVFDIQDPNVYAPRLVSYAQQGVGPQFQIYHALGLSNRDLTQKQSYDRVPKCGDKSGSSRYSGDARSSFCIP